MDNEIACNIPHCRSFVRMENNGGIGKRSNLMV